jgi:hypothetical protein
VLEPAADATAVASLVIVASWICPKCKRQFARSKQSHLCAPALSIEEYFSTGPAHERPVFDAVVAHLATLGPVTIEPVQVGIFIKKAGSFIELRSKVKCFTLCFPLPVEMKHPRLSKKSINVGSRAYHFVNLSTPADVDDLVKDWITESYDSTP